MGARQIPVEAVYIIFNLGMSKDFTGTVDFDNLEFPSSMFVDYIRWVFGRTACGARISWVHSQAAARAGACGLVRSWLAAQVRGLMCRWLAAQVHRESLLAPRGCSGRRQRPPPPSKQAVCTCLPAVLGSCPPANSTCNLLTRLALPSRTCRVYQSASAINVGCSPAAYPTAQYIACNRDKYHATSGDDVMITEACTSGAGRGFSGGGLAAAVLGAGAAALLALLL